MSTQRIRQLAAAGRLRGMDAIILMPGPNLAYLTGLSLHLSERVALAIIPTDGRDLLIVLPGLEQPRAQSEFQAGVPVQWFPWSDDEGPMDALRRAAGGLIGRTVGVEFITMRVLELRAIEEVAGVHAIDATDALASLRMHKDAAELALMREAVRIVETGLRIAIESIRPGRTERQIAAIWEDAMRDEGAEGTSFATIVASGPNSANPHHTTGDRAIAAGDLVILDGGALYKGYCSDITRTVAVGHISTSQQEMYAAVLAANAAGIAAAQPGASGASIDRAARSVIEEAELGQYFIHRTGHGLGMEIHEPPYISSANRQPLAVGTVFTVEPGVYVAGLGGVRIEDAVLLTASGPETLTTIDRALRILK
ncbi:MAG: aminopeptidase P family protein [Herpetosiphonaceae bacterium]|nr:aminopeptidase P family protein [Herpetosiphonaceae bacterium]